MFETYALAIFLAGALSGGFVVGLTGFGTAMVVSGFWLHFMDPVAVAPLVAICAVAGQCATLRKMRTHIDWRAVFPFLVGAFVGLPIGSWLLDFVKADTIRFFMGVFLFLYCTYMLCVKNLPRVNIHNRLADTVVGAVAGALGGVAGLSGPAPLIWCQLRALPKHVQRGIYQPFNMIVLGAAVALHAVSGRVTDEVVTAFLIAAPATVFGALAGVALYQKLDDDLFRRIVLILLLLSGVVLMGRSMF